MKRNGVATCIAKWVVRIAAQTTAVAIIVYNKNNSKTVIGITTAKTVIDTTAAATTNTTNIGTSNKDV